MGRQTRRASRSSKDSWKVPQASPIHSLVTSGELTSLLPSVSHSTLAGHIQFNPNPLLAQEGRLSTTSPFSSFYPFNTTIEKQSLWPALGNTQPHISRAPLKAPSALLQPLSPPPLNLRTSSWKGGVAAPHQNGSDAKSRTVQQRCPSLLSSVFSSHAHTGCSLQFGKPVKAAPSLLPSPQKPCLARVLWPAPLSSPTLVFQGCCGSSEDLPSVLLQRTGSLLRQARGTAQEPSDSSHPWKGKLQSCARILGSPNTCKIPTAQTDWKKSPPSEIMNSWSWFLLTLWNIC